ncbi:putative alpha-1,2-mannosidase [Nocardioides luteus]|nr:GH92 family glycosyl hydrolase [Nocardioides luteus]MDR7311226.1 putative alpha-1,2-mannosidase [Nocardioides luteus]
MRVLVTCALSLTLLGSGFAATAAPAATPAADLVADPVALVDPLIGSANGGNTYPGAVRPFGMISVSPTSTAGDQTNTAASNGYSHDTTRMRGFSLTHVNGAGCHPGAAGDVPVFPHTGEMTGSPTADVTDATYASDFSHADELAEPGRYRLGLANGAEMDTAVTTRAAVSELTFPADKPANLLFRTSNSLNGSESAVTRIDRAKRTVSGSVLTGAFCGRRGNGGGSNKRSYYRLYFTAQFDRSFSGHGTWVNGELQPGSTEARGGEGYETGAARQGQGSGGYVSFDPRRDQTVQMRIGISYTSQAAAEANLKAEIKRPDTVSSVTTDAKAEWREALSSVEVAGGSRDEQTAFYTGLYHSYLQPNVISDVAGTYWGSDQEVHRIERGQQAQYGNFSGWDQYRAHTQLLALLEPRVAGDFARSLHAYSRQHGGVWDRWLHLSGWTHVMTGDPSAPTLAGFYALGVRNFDAAGAYESLVRQATVPHPDGLSSYGCPGQCIGQRPNLADYLDKGYAPQDTCHCWGGAAETLEDAVADYSLADWGRRLGASSAETDALMDRAGWWQHTFNPDATETDGYQQARKADGSWVSGFSPSTDTGFAQGSSATYTWMVPHDVARLAEAAGGRDRAIERLDAFFHKADGSWQHTGGDPLRYDPTNEPGIHIPWMYNGLGAPWKTQETVRAMASLAYGVGPRGLPGNDDLGTMSAWYVFSAMGIYPQDPARAEMLLSSPIFERVVIHRGNGVDIVIESPQASAENIYVWAVSLDGRERTQSWLPESVMNRGGTVRIDVAPDPNQDWGTAEADLPIYHTS